MGGRLHTTAALAVIAALLAVGILWRGSSPEVGRAAGERLRVLTTTEILADLVQQVGGSHVEAGSLVPPGGDPHSYEPTPTDAARIARTDVTFTNHLLLEEHALIKAIDANAPAGAPNVSLAEAAETYGAKVMPLVEDLGLDVIWLGLRVRGSGAARGATRASEVRLRATRLRGPGRLVAYLTDALGAPEIYFDSGDGLGDADATTLPPAAHTHLNWAFTERGTYRLTLAAELVKEDGTREPLGAPTTFTFAVGVEPHGVKNGGDVLDDGHTDLTVDLDTGELFAFASRGDVLGEQEDVDARAAVIDVPSRALETVPDDERFRFLGAPGTRIFQLPQAVLGKHVHGEIDPHLWEDVGNAQAYVKLIRDTLVRADPEHADDYRAATEAYLRELQDLDRYVAGRIARIDRAHRQLITTHDAFGYLANAYDMTVAGFVVPNPAQQPSAAQVRTLTDTVANLRVPAVFVEPNLQQRASVLRQVASDQGVRVCKLYGDAFDAAATTYVAMMRHNADELLRCLGDGR
jgi:anchored repeat ABC transporter substrate-binding protein